MGGGLGLSLLGGRGRRCRGLVCRLLWGGGRLSLLRWCVGVLVYCRVRDTVSEFVARIVHLWALFSSVR